MPDGKSGLRNSANLLPNLVMNIFGNMCVSSGISSFQKAPKNGTIINIYHNYKTYALKTLKNLWYKNVPERSTTSSPIADNSIYNKKLSAIYHTNQQFATKKND